jgi:hypothetical protein
MSCHEKSEKKKKSRTEKCGKGKKKLPLNSIQTEEFGCRAGEGDP